MTPIQQKSLKHVLKTLGSFNDYSVYAALNSGLEESAISEINKSKAMSKYEEAMRREKEKIVEAVEWINAILKDEVK